MHTALEALLVRLFSVSLLFAVQELDAGDTVDEAALEQIRDVVENPNCEAAAISAVPLPMCAGVSGDALCRSSNDTICSVFS